MPFNSAEEAFAEFQRTGQYANSAKHFGDDPVKAQEMFGAYKQMIPQQVKRDFKAKVAGNEARAIEGLSQGQTREQRGIFNRPEEGQALWRRLAAGLGTGLDMNKAYDWGGGSAREVGTTDMAKWGTTRGITGDERQRWNDFSAAGSPEAFWSGRRASQIQGLLNSGDLTRDAQGRLYNDPENDASRRQFYDPYGNFMNAAGQQTGGGYNFGDRAAMPVSGPARQGGPMPFSYGNAAGTPAPTQAPYGGTTSSTGPGAAPSLPSGLGSPLTGGGGGSLPSSARPLGGAPVGAYGAGQQAAQQYAPGGAPGGAPVGAPPQNGGGFAAPAYGGAGAPQAGKSEGDGVIYERRPGTVGPFGAPGTGNPSGNSLFPAVGAPGSGGPMDPSSGGASGGGQQPGWRPEGNLPGVPVSPTGRPQGMGDFTDFMNTPFGQQLAQGGQGDLRIQDFNLLRALSEYEKSQGYENAIARQYGDILGIDPTTGEALTGPAADTANARSFGALAPQVSRIMGDTDALAARLRRQAPEGGEKTAALGDLFSESGATIGGLRQDQYANALNNLQGLMMAEKSFDPGAYTGGAQSLLGAYGQGRGQDIGAYGQALDAMLGQRGQDVTWGLGQGNLGLGWAGLGQQGAQNAWQNYLTGRGQDMDLYSTTRGQDFAQQAAREAARQQQQQSRRGFWGNILGTVGGLAGTLFGGPAGGAVGSQLGRFAGGGSSGGW